MERAERLRCRDSFTSCVILIECTTLYNSRWSGRRHCRWRPSRESRGSDEHLRSFFSLPPPPSSSLRHEKRRREREALRSLTIDRVESKLKNAWRFFFVRCSSRREISFAHTWFIRMCENPVRRNEFY